MGPLVLNFSIYLLLPLLVKWVTHKSAQSLATSREQSGQFEDFVIQILVTALNGCHSKKTALYPFKSNIKLPSFPPQLLPHFIAKLNLSHILRGKINTKYIHKHWNNLLFLNHKDGNTSPVSIPCQASKATFIPNKLPFQIISFCF